jgi:hypothetical protein
VDKKGVTVMGKKDGKVLKGKQGNPFGGIVVGLPRRCL